MARKASNRDQIVTVYVGISASTKTVRRVSLYGDGTLRIDGSPWKGNIGSRNADREVEIQCGLSDVFSYSPQFWNADWVKDQTAALEAKATDMQGKGGTKD